MAGTLALGRKAPELKVSFYAPLSDLSTPVQIGGRDLNPDVLSLNLTTAINCGYQQGQIVWDISPWNVNDAEPEIRRHLEERGDIRHFVHVRVTDNTEVVWEGRISKVYAPGGLINRADVIGYGAFATKDYPLQWTATSPTYTSGEVIRLAAQTAAPMLRIGAPGEQFVDPQVPHTLADIADTKYLSEVLDQVVKEGNTLGQQVWFGVYERRTLYLLPLVPPAVPDYLVDWSQAVDYPDDGENLYGALVLTYSGGTKSPLLWPAGGVNSAWVNEWGLSINGFPRTAHIDGGTLTDARAQAYAQTQLGVLSQPVAAAKVTLGGPTTGEGELPGIQLGTGGGTIGPHLVRAGKWVQIGAADAGKTKLLPIVRTTLNVSAGAVTNVLELGSEYPDAHRFVADLQRSARYYALSASPNTGAST